MTLWNTIACNDQLERINLCAGEPTLRRFGDQRKAFAIEFKEAALDHRKTLSFATQDYYGPSINENWWKHVA